MIAIGFHESCHLWAARRVGLQTKGFYMLPFMGGVALVADRYKTLAQQAFVVLAGPVGGGLLALVTVLLYHLTGWPIVAAAAAWMLLVNAFNLLPLAFLDGGQLLDTITYSIGRTIGMVFKIASNIVAPIVIFFFNPAVALLVIFTGFGTIVREYHNWKHYKDKDYKLCDDNYLHPPQKLSVNNMILTLSVWIVSAILLLVVNHWLLKHV